PMVLFFVASDMIRGVGGSFIHRYQVINILGAILIVSYFLSEKMAESKWLFFAMYIIIIGMGIFSIIKSVSDNPGTLNGDATIREGKYYSTKDYPLIITDFEKLPMGLGYLEFLEVANAIESNQVDIIYASPNIKNFK